VQKSEPTLMMTMHLLTSLQEERLFHIMQTGTKQGTKCHVIVG